MRIDEIVKIEIFENFGKGYPLDKAARDWHGIVGTYADVEHVIINGRTHVAREGTVFFLSKGLSYRVELPNNHIKCYVIDFLGEVDEPYMVLHDCRELFEKFAAAEKLWRQRREDRYYRLDCMSITYAIYAELLRRRDLASVPLRKRDRISPALELLHERYTSPELRISSLAEAVGMTERGLCRSFTEVYGCSPKRYLDNLRLGRAKELLTTEGISVALVAQEVGFRDIYHFSSFFRREVGCSPSEFRASAVILGRGI